MDSMRQTFKQELENLVKSDPSIIALTADLSTSVGMNEIKNIKPKQFIQCGIAEQEMISLGAGLALSGSKPFCGSFAAFNPGRNWDQIRTSICYNQSPVRIISTHYGLSVGGDGATHQCLEYLSLVLPLPNLDVLMPYNNSSTKYAINYIYNQNQKGSILFLPRENHTEKIESLNTKGLTENGFTYFQTNENQLAKTLVISCGLIAGQAYTNKDYCDLLFMVNLTCFNETKFIEILQKYNQILILEEHQAHGGLGSLVFPYITSLTNRPKIKHICTQKTFGQSSSSGIELWEKHKLDSNSILKELTSIW
jgi:transketolase